MKRITKVVIRHMIDEDPDTSYMGEYTDKYDDWVIDRREGEFVHNIAPFVDARAAAYAAYDLPRLPPQRGREFRYFTPADNGEEVGSDDWQKYAKQDFARMESLNNGQWCYIGIRAEAETQISVDGGKTWKCETITSGGLWGIESDSDKGYFETVASDELGELKKILREYGFSERQINASCKAEQVDTVND